MSRPASGAAEVLKSARQAIASAQTVEQLRQAQSVVLPLDHGSSLADTAQVLGVSRGWAYHHHDAGIGATRRYCVQQQLHTPGVDVGGSIKLPGSPVQISTAP